MDRDRVGGVGHAGWERGQGKQVEDGGKAAEGGYGALAGSGTTTWRLKTLWSGTSVGHFPTGPRLLTNKIFPVLGWLEVNEKVFVPPTPTMPSGAKSDA